MSWLLTERLNGNVYAHDWCTDERSAFSGSQSRLLTSITILTALGCFYRLVWKRRVKLKLWICGFAWLLRFMFDIGGALPCSIALQRVRELTDSIGLNVAHCVKSDGYPLWVLCISNIQNYFCAIIILGNAFIWHKQFDVWWCAYCNTCLF